MREEDKQRVVQLWKEAVAAYRLLMRDIEDLRDYDSRNADEIWETIQFAAVEDSAHDESGAAAYVRFLEED